MYIQIQQMKEMHETKKHTTEKSVYRIGRVRRLAGADGMDGHEKTRNSVSGGIRSRSLTEILRPHKKNEREKNTVVCVG